MSLLSLSNIKIIAVMQVLIELPYCFFQTVFYGVTVYAMMGFEWTVAKFFWYLYFMYFTLLYFTYYGMMCVGLTPNASVSAIISAAFYGIWNLFSGFLIPRPVSSLTPHPLMPVFCTEDDIFLKQRVVFSRLYFTYK